MAIEKLNKVLYTEQDFTSAVNGVKGYLQTNYPTEFNDYVNSNLGQALIDIIAYAHQNLSWYLNRKVTDLYFPTAVTPNSISKLARMLGYKAQGASPSIAGLSVTLTDGPYSFPVQITKGFQFQGPNALIFEYRQNTPVTFAPGDTVHALDVEQGYTVINNFVSNGENNQVFRLVSVPEGKFVSVSSFEVRVDGVLWTEYPVIPFENVDAFESNILAYPPTIKFGDGVQGNVPVNGAGIEVKYFVTDGFRGRVQSQTITDPVNSLVVQFQDIPLQITQSLPSAGGDDPEDIRSITVNAPKFQRTQDRAITKGDYDYLTNLFPNVAKGDAQIIRSVSGDITINSVYSLLEDELAKLFGVSGCSVSGGEMVSGVAGTVSGYLGILYDYLDETLVDTCNSNTVQVSILSKDYARNYVSPSQTTINSLKAYLDQRKDVVHTVKVVDGISRVIPADVIVEVKASVNAIEDDVVAAIEDLLIKSDVPPLGILIEREFNKSLYLWEINKTIRDNIVDRDIDYINVMITGPIQYLDEAGNLICPDGYVIQKGTVLIKKLPRF